MNPKFSHLDTDGIVRVGERVEPGSTLVNKHMPSNTNDTLPNPLSLPDSQYKPFPLTYKGPTFGYVDKVLVTSSENDHCIIKVLMRSTRRPELGDKFRYRSQFFPLIMFDYFMYSFLICPMV
jgi:DNA-directed RNA polymerase III subunit RPC2